MKPLPYTRLSGNFDLYKSSVYNGLPRLLKNRGHVLEHKNHVLERKNQPSY